MRFADKIAFVTGAASGIGRATALRLASEGAGVACADLNEEGARETASAVEEAGRPAIALGCNVTDRDSVRAAVDAAVEHLGGLDALFNVAGTGGMQHTEDVDEAEWQRVLSVNLTGTFFASQAAIPHLLGRRRSAIVNVASVAGLNGQAYCAAYCASKAGVVGLTKALAIEYAKRGLRVNCVCPGAVKTPLMGSFAPPEGADLDLVRRLGLLSKFTHPEEVAGALAYLASEDARSVNGVALALDFGNSAA